MTPSNDVLSLLNLSLEQAKEKLTLAGTKFRVVCEDGVSHMKTADHRMDRVNLTVFNGIVTGVDLG